MFLCRKKIKVKICFCNLNQEMNFRTPIYTLIQMVMVPWSRGFGILEYVSSNSQVNREMGHEYKTSVIVSIPVVKGKKSVLRKSVQTYSYQCNILKHFTDSRCVREWAKWMTTSCPEPIYNWPLMNVRSPLIRCSQTTNSWSKPR